MSKPVHKEVKNLEDIWVQQAALNRQAGFDTLEMGKALAAEEREASLPECGGFRVPVGVAIKNYLDALVAECMELQDCLSWKHWYKEAKEGRQYELRDLQNGRVEAIDILFFWVSICQLLGLEPTDVLRLYSKKLDINLRRQQEGRSQAEHTAHEDENKGVV
ncbi:MAG TPA: hypothetical protein VMZ31_03000 [Phycisphaerae bacterium]|nr:hypothetical protein [Phycisphaerae bacterium]